jgi:hypothetical protein
LVEQGFDHKAFRNRISNDDAIGKICRKTSVFEAATGAMGKSYRRNARR